MSPRLRRQTVDGLELERGEKVLATSRVVMDLVLETGPDDDPSTAAATTSGLALLHAGRQVWRRRWHELDAGVWDAEERVLRVTGVDGWATDLRLGDDARLALAVVVRDRVQASVVATRHAQVGEGPIVRVTVRQVQGGPEAGSLVVQEVAPPGVTVTGALAARVRERRREVEGAVGLSSSGGA